MEHKRLEALNAAKEAGALAEMDYSNQPMPKCPHCGSDFSIDDNEAWHLYAEGDNDVECPVCELEFTVASCASYTFSTDEQPDDDDA